MNTGRESGGGSGQASTREEKVKTLVDDIMEKMPEQFNMMEIMAKVEERTPYVIVCFQECERMNILTAEMRRSLKELDLGLKGELTITSDMEDLSNALFFDQVKYTGCFSPRQTFQNLNFYSSVRFLQHGPKKLMIH